MKIMSEKKSEDAGIKTLSLHDKTPLRIVGFRASVECFIKKFSVHLSPHNGRFSP